MTVQSNNPVVNYTGNGVTTSFNAPANCISPPLVALNGVTLTLNSDYTLVSAGGLFTTVLMNVAPANLAVLSVKLNEPFTQLTHWVEGDPFPAASHENAADHAVLLAQQLQGQLAQAPTLPVGTQSSAPLGPPPSGTVLGWLNGAWTWVAAATSGLQALLASGQGAAQVGDTSGANQHMINLGAQSIWNLGVATPAQYAAWLASPTTYDMTAIINAALAASLYVKLPKGVYLISSPLLMAQPKQVLMGDSHGGTQILLSPTFAGATVGGQTYIAAIWYQPTAGNWYDQTGWIIGGAIENLTINCSPANVTVAATAMVAGNVYQISSTGGGSTNFVTYGAANNNVGTWFHATGAGTGTGTVAQQTAIGILFNRVTQQMLVKNVHIYYPTIGILSTWFGWCHNYQDVYVQDASVTSIRLGNGCNGVSMSGCYLWGTDVMTPVLLDINGDLYHGTQAMEGASGNSFTGGSIEGGLIGARINVGQCAFNGGDFESITQGFCTTTGFFNPILQLAGPSTVFNGVQFIGLTSAGFNGFTNNGAQQSHNGCYYLNSGSGPTTQYLFNGVATGQGLSNLTAQGISVLNPAIIGWGTNLYTGIAPTFQVLGQVLCDGVQISTTASKGSQTWTPTSNLGGSGISYGTPRFTIMSDRADFTIDITGTGLTSTVGTTTLALPAALTFARRSTVQCVNANQSASGIGVAYNGTLYLPTIASTSEIVISGTLWLD